MSRLETRYLDLISGRTRGPAALLGRAALRAASAPYGAVTRLRNLAFDRGWKIAARAAVPVVSVGNLTAGGTGKTPCVEWVARFYRDRGLMVAVLSRGYGADAGRNDEAMVLEENLPDVPHLQDRDRAALAATAVEELDSEVLVLDDGFQHRRLARDLDVVLIDATNPWGHGLLPRGLLRESPRGLRRAGVVVVTRADQGDAAAVRAAAGRYAPGVPVAEAEHRPAELVNGDGTASLESVRGRPALAFAGIGNPQAFRRTAEGLGAAVADFRAYPDHHPYRREDVDDLRRWAAGLPPDGVVLTTQKDWVKLRLSELAGRPLWAVRVGMHFRAGREELEAKLRAAVGGRGG